MRTIFISAPTESGFEQRSTTGPVSSPYTLVDSIRGKWQELPAADYHPHHQTLIDDIMPIHNVEGIRDLSQISAMTESLKAGLHLLDSGNLPNIKLILAPNGELLLFDGHHSLLAHYQHGHRTINQVPHLLIAGNDYQPVTSNELLPFFPTGHDDKILTDWSNYVVNWQRPVNQQLEARAVTRFAELVKALAIPSAE